MPATLPSGYATIVQRMKSTSRILSTKVNIFFCLFVLLSNITKRQKIYRCILFGYRYGEKSLFFLFKKRSQSSHRFPYGYLVTTSPQSKAPPWYPTLDHQLLW